MLSLNAIYLVLSILLCTWFVCCLLTRSLRVDLSEDLHNPVTAFSCALGAIFLQLVINSQIYLTIVLVLLFFSVLIPALCRKLYRRFSPGSGSSSKIISLNYSAISFGSVILLQLFMIKVGTFPIWMSGLLVSVMCFAFIMSTRKKAISNNKRSKRSKQSRRMSSSST